MITCIPTPREDNSIVAITLGGYTALGTVAILTRSWMWRAVSLAAQKLGISEGAVRVAIHRLRRRFRELVKAEIAQTVADSAEVGQELNFLLAALS